MAETPGRPTHLDRCAAVRDELPAHALGALDAEDKRRLDAHLAACAGCREELAHLEETVGMLGAAVALVPPRPEVRAALLRAIAAPVPSTPFPDTQSRPLQPARPMKVGERHWLWRVGFPVAASLALVAVAVLTLLLDRAIEEREAAQEAQRRIAGYLGEGGHLAPLLPAAGAAEDVASGHGSLAVAPNQPRAMLVVYDLQPSDDGLRYMAWAERDRQRVRLGEVMVGSDGTGYLMLYGPEPINTYDRVGITRFAPDAPDGEPFLVATVPPEANLPPSTPTSPVPAATTE